MVKIMIVDNHSLMRRAVREVIEQEGDLLVVAEACSSFEAEALAVETQPDVILLDLEVPGANGFGLMERIRTCSPNACIVIFTAHEQYVFQALQNGAMGYITKDVEPDALLHAIRCAARNDLCIPGTLAADVIAHLRDEWQAQEAMRWHTASKKGCNEEKGLSFTQALTACWSPNALPEAMTAMAANGYRTQRRARRARASNPPDPNATPRAPRPLTERERQILDQMRKGCKNREIAMALDIAESTVHKHVQNIFEKLHARNRTEAIYLSRSGI